MLCMFDTSGPARRVRPPMLSLLWIAVALAAMPWLDSTSTRAQDVPPPPAPQAAPPPQPCWEIVAPVAGTDPPAMVMLNRCTGDTWLLAKEVTREAQPTAPGTYVYRWRRIMKTDDGGAAGFPLPSASRP
jgi:hypothetical protein